MKKVILLFVLGAAMMLYVAPVHAISLPAGEMWGHMSDWTSFWGTEDRNGNQRLDEGEDFNDNGVIDASVLLPIGTVPIAGDEGRALASVDQFYNAAGPQWNFGDNGEELSILEYDFVVLGFDPANPNNLYFGPGPEYGGKIDAWLDSTPDWTSGPVDFDGNGIFSAPEQGPGAWQRAGGQDDYPGASDIDYASAADAGVSLWLTGTWAKLWNDVNFNGIRDPGELDLWIDFNSNGVKDDIVPVYEIALFTPTGLGSGSGWIDLTGGSYLPNIQQNFFGPGYDISVSVDMSASKYGSPYGWNTRSSDPIYFKVIPTPGSIAMLCCLATGLFGARNLRRRWH